MLFNTIFNHTNLIAGSISCLVAFIILFKDLRSSVNVLFSISLLSWGLSLIFNALTFLFRHPTAGAQALRDMVTICSSIASFMLFLSAYVIYRGVFYLKKWYVIVPFVVGLFINTFLCTYFDGVVYDSPDGVTDLGIGIKTTQDAWVMIFLYFIPLLLIMIAVFYLVLTKRETEDAIIRSRINYFIIGFSTIVLGAIVFSSSGIIEQLYKPLSMETELSIFFAAEVFWILGPIMMLVGINLGRLKIKAEV